MEAYGPGDRTQRQENESFKRWTHGELDEREGFNLDVWASLVDESLEDPSNIPPPDVVAREILEHLASASEQFEAVAAELEPGEAPSAGAGAGEL